LTTTTTTKHDSPDRPTRDGPTPLLLRPDVLLGLVVVALLYGSLIPFDFAWSQAVERSGGTAEALRQAWTSPAWVEVPAGQSSTGLSFAASDLAMNLLLYLPLGVALRMALRSWWRCWPFEVLASAALALALSWSVEAMQSLMPMRVASLNDIAANTGAAIVAALLAPLLWRLYRRAAFRVYCRSAYPVAKLRAIAARPGVAIALAVVNAIVIGLWYLDELQKSGVGDESLVVLPFERAFELPYDIGVLVLGEALLAYAGIGCLLLLLTYTGTQRAAMKWVVLGVVSLALIAELSRAATRDAVPDVTGPLLALSAAAIMTLTMYSFGHAVRRANRRQQPEPYVGPERRRVPHDYA
jgi:hypothetical protein